MSNAVATKEPQEMRHLDEPRQHAPMVDMIERIVMDPSIPIDRLERVLAMKERMEDRAREDDQWRAKKAYFGAMSRCQAELPVVTKNKTNSHTESKYADLAAIEEQAMPIIHRHGFGVTFQPAGYNEKGELQIKWKIVHDEGHSESDTAGIPVDGAGSQGKVNKTGTQAFGSTATYGRRYLLCMLFNISTGDDNDGNAAKVTQEFVSEEQAENLRALLDKTGGDVRRFCERIKVNSLSAIYASKYDAAVKIIESRAQRAAEGAKTNG